MFDRPLTLPNPPPANDPLVAEGAASDAARAGEPTRLDGWEYATFTLAHAAGSALLSILSVNGLYRFGRLFGTVEWLINHKRRRRFAAALRQVLGREASGAERRRWTRDHFMRSRCDKLFYLVFDCIPRAKAMTLLSITNPELLDQALSRGRGVYVALSHHGALHVVSLLLALRGYKTAGVRDRQEGALRRYIQRRFDRRYPEFARMRVLYADSFPREVYRCLSEGYVLGSAMDVNRVRHPNQRTETVTVFGETRLFPSGPLRIAHRCRAPVLQAFVLPESGFRYRLEIVAMLMDPDLSRDEDETVAAAMRTYAANVERYVGDSPSLLTRT
jgi:lauroyl/myristoyl acyltransferase